MMLPRFSLLLIGATVAGGEGNEDRVRTSAPVRQYAVSFFSDQGYPHVRVTGSSADLADPDRIVLQDMTLTVYTGGIDRDIESSLTAPIAFLEPGSELVHGSGAVSMKRPDLELSGADWSYDHRERRVRIHRQARIVFKTQFEELLR